MRAIHMARMHKTTIYLDEDLLRKLRSLSDASGRPRAEIIRDAILAYAVGPKRKRPRSIGLGRGGKNLSQRADGLLDGFGEER